MSDDACLTTVDNPFSPFSQFDQWLAFDMAKGYNTCGVLAAVSMTSNELSDADNERVIDEAIDELVALNPLGLYRKARKGDYPADKALS